jgi:hypothetical protein
MSKRPPLDLMTLTSEHAAPMPEGAQRHSQPAMLEKKVPKSIAGQESVKTANLRPLAFKVPPAFCKRYKQRALDADLSLIELLFEALDAWEQKRKTEK